MGNRLNWRCGTEKDSVALTLPVAAGRRASAPAPPRVPLQPFAAARVSLRRRGRKEGGRRRSRAPEAEEGTGCVAAGRCGGMTLPSAAGQGRQLGKEDGARRRPELPRAAGGGRSSDREGFFWPPMDSMDRPPPPPVWIEAPGGSRSRRLGWCRRRLGADGEGRREVDGEWRREVDGRRRRSAAGGGAVPDRESTHLSVFMCWPLEKGVRVQYQKLQGPFCKNETFFRLATLKKDAGSISETTGSFLQTMRDGEPDRLALLLGKDLFPSWTIFYGP